MDAIDASFKRFGKELELVVNQTDAKISIIETDKIKRIETNLDRISRMQNQPHVPIMQQQHEQEIHIEELEEKLQSWLFKPDKNDRLSRSRFAQQFTYEAEKLISKIE